MSKNQFVFIVFKWLKLVLVIFSFLGCVVAQDEQNKSFEGIITYKVEVEFKDNIPIKYKEYLRQKRGHTMLAYYDSKGNIYKDFPYSGGNGLDFHIYNSQKQEFYAKYKHLDTLYFYDTSENMLKLLDKKKGETNDEILGQKCSFIEFSGIIPKTKERVRLKFWYSGKPYLNPNLFKGFKDFYNSEFFKISKSPFLKLILELDYHSEIYTVINIEEKKLNDSIFTIPRDYIRKKL